MRRAAAPALNHHCALLQRFGLLLPLARPVPHHPVPYIVVAHRQRPGRGSRVLQYNRLLGPILNHRPARKYAVLRIHAIVEMNEQRAFNVFQYHFELIAIDAMAHVMQYQVAIAVLKRRLDRRLGVELGTPACILLRRPRLRSIVGRKLRQTLHRLQVIETCNLSAPEDRLQFSAFVHRRRHSSARRPAAARLFSLPNIERIARERQAQKSHTKRGAAGYGFARGNFLRADSSASQ